jgi:hypothetical protein
MSIILSLLFTNQKITKQGEISMKYEIGHKKNKGFLDGIEELDSDNKELASKKGNEDDLSWLGTETANNEESFLDGIEKIDTASSLSLLKSYARRGILEVVQKQANGKQLSQFEMNLLRDFRKHFPDIDMNELEEAANATK